MLNVRNLSIALTLTFLITVYLKQIPNNIHSKTASGTLIKHIVAYSLKKRIEIEANEALECPTQRIAANPSDDRRRKPWTQQQQTLPDTNLQVYSIHEDYRLDPYNYIRILATTKG